MLKKFKTIFYSAKTLAIKKGVKMGDNCIIAKTVDFGSEPYLISIGNNFYSSDNIKFITHDGAVNVIRNLYEEFKNADLINKIKIGNNVFLGVDVVVLPGTIIRDNVIVGAKSVVKGELKSNSVYAGIPAKYVCSLKDYLEKNEKKFTFTKSLNSREKKAFLLKELSESEN